jgi:hypothetical protein
LQPGAKPIERLHKARYLWYFSSVRRIKAAVAMVLALLWLPAVSCCLIDASGLLGKQDCCSQEHSHPASSPGHCDQPCGVLASGSYLPQQNPVVIPAPLIALLPAPVTAVAELQPVTAIGRDVSATAPPEVAGHWQFSFRTALSPRAPSFIS